MCVVSPSIDAALLRSVNTADRWSGANCIFTFPLSCLVILARQKIRVACACLLCDDRWWLGAATIQVLINSDRCTSLEMPLVEVSSSSYIMPLCQFRSLQAGAATEGGQAELCSASQPPALTAALPDTTSPSRGLWLRRPNLGLTTKDCASLSVRFEKSTPLV